MRVKSFSFGKINAGEDFFDRVQRLILFAGTRMKITCLIN